MLIRVAEIADLTEILEIYNREAKYTLSTMDVDAKTIDEWKTWFYAHNLNNHPLIVAEIDGVVVGYVSLSKFREKSGYASSVELSIYVDSRFRRRGIASALMSEIISIARADERTHSIISIVTDINDASRGLHQKFGFEHCGRVREAGMKFGRYIDIDYYQLLV